MTKIIITDAQGNSIEVEVSQEVATYLEENNSYMKKLEHIDEREFNLVHYDKPAWENLSSLSTGFSAEDECLDIPQDILAAEQTAYEKRLAQCRQAFQALREVCTPTQWRRYQLYRVKSLTTWKIAEMEGCKQPSVMESIRAVEKKMQNIFKN